MNDTDSMTVPEVEAIVAAIDDVGELRNALASELDGQDRKGVKDAINARLAQLEGDTEYPAYQLEPDTKYVVAYGDGEVEFTTDEDGRFTPTSEREAWALNELGAKPGKE